MPLSSVGPHTGSPFSDPAVLEAQWVELEQIFKDERLVSELGSYHVLIVCYNGDTARVATSVLRAKGIDADSVHGGHHALRMYGIGSDTTGYEVSVSAHCATSKMPLATTVSVSEVPP